VPGSLPRRCAENRSRLSRLRSGLEFRLRLQQFVELAREGRRLEAVEHARRHLASWALPSDKTDKAGGPSALQQQVNAPTARQPAAPRARPTPVPAVAHPARPNPPPQHLAELTTALGALAFSPAARQRLPAYRLLFEPAAWRRLSEGLLAEHCRLHGLPGHPLLDVYLQVGWLTGWWGAGPRHTCRPAAGPTIKCRVQGRRARGPPAVRLAPLLRRGRGSP
jgi:macrophage erythroblast attacher